MACESNLIPDARESRVEPTWKPRSGERMQPTAQAVGPGDNRNQPRRGERRPPLRRDS